MEINIMKRFQRRTIKSPCCNTKTHITFQYGALIIGAFCDCGKNFYMRFKPVKSHLQGYKGKRAGRLMMKADNGNLEALKSYKPKRKRRKKK
jgi:hypothetical protein